MSGRGSVQKTIAIEDLERQYRTVLEEVIRQGVAYLVTKDDQPGAALIPYPELVRLQKRAQLGTSFWEQWERSTERLAAANAHFTDDEVEADVTAAVEEVRAEIWAREQAEAR